MSKVALEDNRLSFKAKGILAYLLSKPDNWKSNVVDISKHSSEGITAVRSGLKELVNLNYASIKRRKDEKGQFVDTECIIYENPIENKVKNPHNGINTPEAENLSMGDPKVEDPKVEDPKLGNLHYNNNNINNNDINKNENKLIKTSAPKSGDRQPPNNSANKIEYILAELLWCYIETNGRKQKQPNLTEWSKHIRLLITIDDYTPTDVEEVIVWCQTDPFWKKNIRSAGKLRKQFKILNAARQQMSTCNFASVEKIINAYNVNFLGGSVNHMKISASDRLKFTGAVNQISQFSKKTKIPFDEILASLVRCLSALHSERGDMVYPGHLCSKHTWDKLMPQYLKGTFNPELLGESNE